MLLRDFVERNPHKSTLKVTLDFNTSQSTIYSHLKIIVKLSKLGASRPDTLSEKNKEDPISITQVFFQSREMTRFSRISLQVTKNGSFIAMFNAKGSRLTRKNYRNLPHELHGIKVVQCICWHQRGIIHFEVLSCRHSTAATCAWKPSEKTQRACQLEKRCATHDNAKSHSARITRETILDFGWYVLSHPPYSPDLAFGDVHVFLS